MHYNTKQKLRAIKKYLMENGKDIMNTYEGVNGIYVAKRIRKKKVINRYCIVFNVQEKQPEELLESPIPDYVEVGVKLDGVKLRYRVPTDVRQVGSRKLQRCLASSRSGGRESEGTVTGFLNRNGRQYYLSNMHVMGYAFIDNGDFEAESNDDDPDIRIQGSQACAFRKGILERDGELDVAMAEVMNNHPMCRSAPFDLDDFNHVPEEDLEFVMADPILINSYGFVNETDGEARIVNYLSGPVDFEMDNIVISLFNLIQIQPVISTHQDSGALIFDDNDNAYGILVGADDASTYAINLRKSIDYLFE
jgi:hypothetical protein